MDVNSCLEKILSSNSHPVKEKHLKFLMNQVMSENKAFWSIFYAGYLKIGGGTPVRAWKCCYLLHYFLFHGSGSLTVEQSNKLKTLEGQHGPLVEKYIKFLVEKNQLRATFPGIPGDWKILHSDLLKLLMESDCWDFHILDYFEHLIDVQQAFVEFLKNEKFNTLSDRGRCYMTPITLLLNESAQIRDFCHHTIFESEFADTLKEHQERFNALDERFTDCFKSANNFSFIMFSLPKSLRERFET